PLQPRAILGSAQRPGHRLLISLSQGVENLGLVEEPSEAAVAVPVPLRVEELENLVRSHQDHEPGGGESLSRRRDLVHEEPVGAEPEERPGPSPTETLQGLDAAVL